MHEEATRADFLRDVARAGLAAGLIGAGAALLIRNGGECATPNQCAACGAFAGCEIRLARDKTR